jgi:polyisoprenoid-binding protein YceI
VNEETQISGARFVIDGAQSRLSVAAFAGGLLSFAGHNPTFAVRKFGGEILFTSGGAADSLLVVVESGSLQLLDEKSESDRREIENTMRRDVLETGKFAEIFFVSKNVAISTGSNGNFAVTAGGVLSLHGEKHPQTITAEATISNEIIRAHGGFSLKQSDYKIERVRALGGTLTVKDDVRIEFEIEAKV